MDRRDFIAGLGAGTYSLIVFAEDLIGQDVTGTAARAPEAKAIAESIACGTARDGTAVDAHEKNMLLVEHACDILVAGGGLAGVCAALARRVTVPRSPWFRTAHAWAATRRAK